MPNTVYISFSSEINQITTEALLSVCGQQVQAKVEEIHLLLSTPGGSVFYGITLYNVLKSLPVKLITHNVGNVNSIGNVVFLAGAERYACSVSSFMFHGVGFEGGNTRFEEKILRERLDGLLTDQKLIGDIIQKRTSINAEECETLFLQAVTRNPTFAKEKEIIHDIREVEIPKGTPFLQLVFQRQGV